MSTEMEPPWRDAVMKPALGSLIKDGHLTLPEGPGWGVEIDEPEIAKHPHFETWRTRLLQSREGLTVK